MGGHSPRRLLRERDLGVLEALTTEEMLESEPETYRSFRNDGPEWFLRAGRGYFKQFCDRCSRAVEGIALAHEGAKIGIVTHGGVLGVAIFVCKHSLFRFGRLVAECPSRKGAASFVLLNCSLNRIEKKTRFGTW